MSQANLELFYDKVIHDPALLHSLTAGVTTPAEFIERAIGIGNAQGYEFTYEEADAWIAAHAAANDSGELSDMQLEAIAGGKSPGGMIAGIFNTAVDGINGLGGIPGISLVKVKPPF